MNDLTQRKCSPLPKDASPLPPEHAESLLGQLRQPWNMHDQSISYDFIFKNFHETMAFVNALAWVAHQQDHHPDLEIGYKHCKVHYSTHSVGGLSENDFICAAKIEALLA